MVRHIGLLMKYGSVRAYKKEHKEDSYLITSIDNDNYITRYILDNDGHLFYMNTMPNYGVKEKELGELILGEKRKNGK